MLDDAEACDDGNEEPGDGCEPDCTSSDEVGTEWELLIDGYESFDDCGTDVEFDGAGNLYVAGYVGNDLSWIRKYDVDYVEQWTVTYPGILGGACVRLGIDVDEFGNVGFVSEVNIAFNNNDVFFGMLNPDGDELWSETVAGGALFNDFAGDVTFDVNGDLLVVARTTEAGPSAALWLSKYDLAGSEIWNRMYGGFGGDNYSGLAVTSDADANVFVTGGLLALGNEDAFTAKYDSDGNEIWIDIFDGSGGNDVTQGVAIDDLGDLRVAGSWAPDRDPQEMWFRSYSNDGAELWTATYAGLDDDQESAFAVDVGPIGEAWFAGISEGAPLVGTGWLGKYDADGEMIWQRRHDISQTWFSVARADDGRIAVAGFYFAGGFQAYEAIWAVYPP